MEIIANGRKSTKERINPPFVQNGKSAEFSDIDKLAGNRSCCCHSR